MSPKKHTNIMLTKMFFESLQVLESVPYVCVIFVGHIKKNSYILRTDVLPVDPERAVQRVVRSRGASCGVWRGVCLLYTSDAADE